jgi:hypothetical protein
VGLISLDELARGLAIPSKTFYMMAAGVVIIALNKVPSDLQLVIEKYQCGFNLEPRDMEGLVELILNYHRDITLFGQHSQAARLAAGRMFSRKVNPGHIFNAVFPSHSIVGIASEEKVRI